MSDAEGSVTAEITDPNGHLVAGVVSLSTSDNDNITVNLGTLDPSGTNLDEIKKLADQTAANGKGGVDAIKGSLTISAADITNKLKTFTNLTSDNNKINFTLDDEVSVGEAAALIAKMHSSATIDFAQGIKGTIGALAKADGSAVSTELAAVLGLSLIHI